jgi:hypothetical protein
VGVGSGRSEYILFIEEGKGLLIPKGIVAKRKLAML